MHADLRKLLFSAVLIVAALPMRAAAEARDDADCPVTVAESRGIGGAFDAPPDMIWFGSDSLAVLLRRDGVWRGMGASRRYGDKQWWWSEGFDPLVDEAALEVTARRLDGTEQASFGRATNASGDSWRGAAMLIGAGFPVHGCWEITGRYHGQSLSFIVRIEAPATRAGTPERAAPVSRSPEASS
ncbi:MAG: hypothetical protein AAFX58_11480 [Pseudomonadota bacterium]